MLRSLAVRTAAVHHARQIGPNSPAWSKAKPDRLPKPQTTKAIARSPRAQSAQAGRTDALTSPARTRAAASSLPHQTGGAAAAAAGETSLEHTKHVVVQSVKQSRLEQIVYAKVFGPTSIQYQNPYFRLRMARDTGTSLSATPPLADPHTVPDWLPQPAHRSTHKRKHLRMLTARLLRLKEHGELDESEMRKVSGYHIDQDPAGTSSKMVVTERMEGPKEEPDTFSVFKSSSTAWPPLPWTARKTEMRVVFINSKKETHKLAVVRSRCRRRIKVALQALFLPLSNTRGRAILGKDGGAREFPLQELIKLVHPDYVYVFIPQPISFTAPMLEMARAMHQALTRTSSIIAARERRNARIGHTSRR